MRTPWITVVFVLAALMPSCASEPQPLQKRAAGTYFVRDADKYTGPFFAKELTPGCLLSARVHDGWTGIYVGQHFLGPLDERADPTGKTIRVVSAGENEHCVFLLEVSFQ